MSGSSSQLVQQHFVALIQAFGVLRTDATPCGQPMSVSTAHAMCELATEGQLHQKELAKRLGLDRSAVSRLVDQLVKRGWAERSPDPDGNDHRVRQIHLTTTGSDVAHRVLEARAERFSRLLDAIDEPKRQQVLDSLHLLKAATDATMH